MNRNAVLLALCAISLVGCGSAPLAASVCERPGTIAVAIESGPLLNPDEEGRALPTEIRLYRLRDANVFETVPFEAIWQDDVALGDALLGVDSLTLYPGESIADSIVPEADAQVMVAMAVVRQPAGRTWRTIIDVGSLPCRASAQVRLRVDEYRIERASVSTGED